MRGPIDLPVSLRRSDVLQFLGYPEDRQPQGPIAEILDEMLAEARTLTRARGVYRAVAIEEASAVGLEPLPAAGLVLGLVTVGSRIEDRATALLEAGESVAALLMDAAGSAAVEEAADRLGAVITGEDIGGAVEPAAVGCRISPGYGRWRLESQTALFRRLPHRDLGVELSPAMLMVPRKSISFAMWLGADSRPLAGLSGCERCELETCRYRKTPTAGGAP